MLYCKYNITKGGLRLWVAKQTRYVFGNVFPMAAEISDVTLSTLQCHLFSYFITQIMSTSVLR